MGNDWSEQNAEELEGNKVKLVTYTIISLAPGAERVLPQGFGYVVVKESMSDCDFKSWIIARYLGSQDYQGAVSQDPGEEVTPREKEIPSGLLQRARDLGQAAPEV